MDKEKEIEELAFSIIGATSPLGVKDLTKQFDYKTVAEYLINAGYGNVKQAVKEFAEKLKQKIKSVSDIGFTGKTEKQLYQRRGMEEGLRMAIEIVDDLVTEL